MNRQIKTCLAALAFIIPATPAFAILQLSSEFNGVTFNCADQQACDTNPAVGQLQIADQTIGGVTVNGSLQVQTIGSVNILNTSSLQVINNNATTVPILLAISGTGFLGPSNTFDASGSGTFQLAVGSDITLAFYDDPTNTQGADTPTDAPGTQVATFTHAATIPADSFSFNQAGALIPPDPALYSMTLTTSGDLTAGAQLISRGQTLFKAEEVPEPGSLALLGAGLLALWFFRRRLPGMAAPA